MERQLERAVEGRENANAVSVRVEVENESLRRQLSGAVEALRGITPESPYDFDQDCEWCLTHIHQPHLPDCAWVKAKAIIDAGRQ